MEWPVVSVIIPLYNYEQYVCDAVYSCLEQKYPGKLEIIVVDDCSTDNSVIKLGQTFSKEQYTLVRHKSNKGYSAAKNTGIRASSGELIVLLDADDMLTPDSINVRADYMRKRNAVDMVYGTAYVIYDEGGYEYYTKRMYKLGIHAGKKIHAQTTMIRRSVHLRFGLYDENLRSRSDNEMWNRLNLYGLFPGAPKIFACRMDDKPFAFYRKHSASMVEYRKKNPIYNRDVTRTLEEAKQMRFREGITKENTPWLKR